MSCIQALIEAARGPKFLGVDKKCLAWLIAHTLLFTLLCYWDTHFTVRLRGAPVENNFNMMSIQFAL